MQAAKAARLKGPGYKMFHKAFATLFTLSCIKANLFVTSTDTLHEDVVYTESGPVLGNIISREDGTAVSVHYGIPYARPPVGELRFAPPQEVNPWKEVKNASEPKPECYQQFTEEQLQGNRINLVSDSWSEDCLTLNVFAPYPRSSNASVLVYIHGGGFLAGSSLLWVDHTILASEGIVVVSANYRLGVFGFFGLDRTDAPGNVGLLDQLLVLKWVQKNIEAFGGDKTSVTLFGASAGSASVGYHILSTESRGLFQRAVMISGTPLNLWTFRERDRIIRRSEAVLNKLGCLSSNETLSVKCLRQETPLNILKAALQPTVMLSEHSLPTVDGTFLTESPQSLIGSGRLNNVQVLIGTSIDDAAVILQSSNSDIITTDDGHIKRSQFHTVVKRSHIDISDPQIQVIDSLYTNWCDSDNPMLLRDAAKAIYNDGVFVCGVNDFSDALARSGNDVYRYVFDHKTAAAVTPSWIKATHASEQFILIGNSQWRFNETAEDLAVRKEMLENFTNFIKTGNPNDPSSREQSWPKYSENTNRQLKHISVSSVIENNYRVQECATKTKILSVLDTLNQC